LEGLISKTSTALVYIARGGAFGAGEGVLKLTGEEYAPLLERELGLLNRCQAAEIAGIVRPLRAELEWIKPQSIPNASAAALLLPFLSGGDLVQWIGEHATRTGRLGAHLGLQIGEQVGGVLRELLRLPKPLVHRDVKPQNVLFPYPDAPLAELTLIDLDASEELDIALEDFSGAPPEIAKRLVEDVNGFGELLFILATGREPPTDISPDPQTGNPDYDSLVVKCLISEPEPDVGYVCLADNLLWQDLEKALATERARPKRERLHGPLPYLLDRRVLAVIGGLLFIALIAAVAAKAFIG